jgi:outer membrane protein assembly factor BamB
LLLPTVEVVHPPRCATLHALDLADGTARWQHTFSDALASGGAVAGETILVTTYSTDPLGQEGALLALDLAGEEQWRWAPGARAVSAPSLNGDLACVTADTRSLVTLVLASGAERSRSSLPATASLAAPAWAGDVIIVPCRGPHLLAVELDGAIRWHYSEDATHTWLDKSPLAVGNRIFAVSSGGTVIALGIEDGARRWRIQVGPAGKSLTAPATDDERLFVGARDGLHALVLDDGVEVWHFETARKIEAAPVVHAGVVYATCHDHHLYALDATSGKELWRYEVDRRIEVPPVLADCSSMPCAVIADRGGTVTAVARPLSAVEHEAAGNWEEAAKAYAVLGHPARAAQLLEDLAHPLQAAERWMEAGEPERAAEQYEVAGAWRQAVELWHQLGQPLRRAQALEAHARSLETVTCSPEDRAVAWAAAARAYETEGAIHQAAVCQDEVARHLRQPLIALDVEIDKGLVLGAWSRLQFIVRNEGHGPARKLFIRASGGQFEGQVMETQQIFTLRKGQERARWLDVCPQAYGDSVPLRVQIEYEDHAGEQHQCEHTIYIPVAREEATRNAGQTINVFVSDRGAAAVGQGAVAAAAGGVAIGGDVGGDVTVGQTRGDEDQRPPVPASPWNTAVIRSLLIAAFSDEELTTLCFDHFRRVYEDFSTGMSKGQKIQLLLDHCMRHNRMTELLDSVKRRNPAQHGRFQDRLQNEESQ